MCTGKVLLTPCLQVVGAGSGGQWGRGLAERGDRPLPACSRIAGEAGSQGLRACFPVRLGPRDDSFKKETFQGKYSLPFAGSSVSPSTGLAPFDSFQINFLKTCLRMIGET